MTALENTPDRDKKPQENGTDKKPVQSGRKSAKEMLAEGYTHDQLLAMGYSVSEIGIRENKLENAFTNNADLKSQKPTPEKPNQKQNENNNPQHNIQSPEIKVDVEATAAKPDATKVEQPQKIQLQNSTTFTKADEKSFFDSIFKSAQSFYSVSKNTASGVLSKGLSFYNKVSDAISSGIKTTYNYVIGLIESNNNYGVVNWAGYKGKYQLGNDALVQSGLLSKDKNGYHWTNTAIKTFGVDSVEDFLNNPKAQEYAMNKYTEKNWQTIKNLNLDDYIGKVINGVKVTEDGLKAAAHLVGVGGLSKALKTGQHVLDGNGVSCFTYMGVAGMATSPKTDYATIIEKGSHKVDLSNADGSIPSKKPSQKHAISA